MSPLRSLLQRQAFAAYVDPNSLDAEVFLNQTMVISDNEEDDEK